MQNRRQTDLDLKERRFDTARSEMPSQTIYYCGEEVDEFGFSSNQHEHGCGPWYDSYMARGGNNG